MELIASLPRAISVPRRLAARIDGNAAAAWTLAFSLVFYLALRNGGYDAIVRSEVGIAVWWIVLLGALGGILPARIGRAGWGAIGLLAAFAAWTGVAIGWSQSAENSVVELARELTYLGFLLLAVALAGRTNARHTIAGVASAIGVVTVLAVLSRLHPQSFPQNVQLQFLGAGSARRLSYPLNYWNALAAFDAIGVPLLAAVAVRARTIVGQALAAGVLPLTILCLDLTVSRGGVLELAVGLAVFLLLFPRRLEAGATLLVGGTGGAILVWAAASRPLTRTALTGPAALHEDARLLAIAVIVCLGVALLQGAIALAQRYLERPAGFRVTRRGTARRGLAMAAAAAVVAVAVGAPGTIVRQWDDFKATPGVVVPISQSTVFSRLSAVNGNGRYQYWIAAVHADDTSPLLGIGPGTFEYWWASHATTDGAVRNAHSLYLETLAETGLVGLALIGGFLLWLAAVAVRRALRQPEPVRVWVAAAAGGLAAFLAAAAIEWVWQMAAVAATALLLAAVLVGAPPSRARASGPATADSAAAGWRWPARGAVALLAAGSLVAIAIPLAGALAIRSSQADAAAGRLGAAYRASLTAQRLQPYAATPRLQEALVLEAAGALGPAALAAEAATQRAPTNWQTWLTLARIDARRGADRAALVALTRARTLDPRSSLFQSHG